MASLKDTALEDRKIALQQGLQLQNSGNEIQNETGFNADAYSDASKGYSTQQDEADAALKATPGYTPDEASKIAPDYSQYQTSPDDLQKRGLTSQEQGQIMGDPKAGFQYFDPSKTTGIQDKSTSQQNDATSALQHNLNNAAGTEQGGLNDATSSGSGQADRALGTEGAGMVSAFGDEASGLKAAVDPTKLSLSSDFTSNYGMTPQQQQDMVTSAGVTTGNRYRSQQSDIARQAAAQGNTSPMAIAAMNEQLNRDSAAGAGDAMTNARIAASNAAATRLQTQEGMRLGSEQDISTRQQNNATTLGNAQMQAVEHYGDSNLANAQTQESDKMTAASTGGAAQMTAASTGGQAGINTADRTGQEALASEQANQKTGQGLATTADTTASARAEDVAGNRQKTTADQQNTQFTQGMTTGQASAAGAGKVADARISGNTALRTDLAGKQSQAQGGALTSKQQQETGLADTTSAFAAQNTGANTATDEAVKANAQPGTFGKIVGGLEGAVSAVGGGVGLKALGVADGGTFLENGGAQTGTPAIVGEAGPEYITNLGKERYGQGTMVTSPTNALMERGDVVVPLNRTGSTKVPASTLNMVPARYRPMADGGILNPQILADEPPAQLPATKYGPQKPAAEPMYMDRMYRRFAKTPPADAELRSYQVTRKNNGAETAIETTPGASGDEKGWNYTPARNYSPVRKTDSAEPMAAGGIATSGVNRTASTKVPASTLNMVPRYRNGGAEPMASGGIATKGPLPSNFTNAIKARYRKPTGPAGPHVPLRVDEPLRTLPAYR